MPRRQPNARSLLQTQVRLALSKATNLLVLLLQVNAGEKTIASQSVRQNGRVSIQSVRDDKLER